MIYIKIILKSDVNVFLDGDFKDNFWLPRSEVPVQFVFYVQVMKNTFFIFILFFLRF